MGAGASGAGAAPAATTMGGTGAMSAADSYAATSANMAGSGSAVSSELGKQGGTAASVGQSAIGTGTVEGSMRAARNDRWKENLKMGLGGIAETKLSDLRAISQFNNNAPVGGGYDESALQKGFKNSDLYNQLMQQQMLAGQQSQVRRYKRGV